MLSVSSIKPLCRLKRFAWAGLSACGAVTFSALFSPAPAWAGWVLVGESAAGDRYHILEETVTELSDDTIVFDTLVRYATPLPNGASTVIDRFTANCRTRQVVNVSWAAFNQDQETIQAEALPNLEANVAPRNSVMTAELERACAEVNL